MRKAILIMLKYYNICYYIICLIKHPNIKTSSSSSIYKNFNKKHKIASIQFLIFFNPTRSSRSLHNSLPIESLHFCIKYFVTKGRLPGNAMPVNNLVTLKNTWKKNNKKRKWLSGFFHVILNKLTMANSA